MERKTIESIKNYGAAISFFFLFFIIILLAISLVPSANAEINIYPQFVTNTSIGWNYSLEKNISSASVDGVLVTDFDNKSGLIIANKLEPNTPHQINIYSYDNDTGSNITWTSSIPKSSEESITDLVWSWIYVIIGVSACIIGAYFKVPFVGFFAVIIALIGFTTSIHGSLIMAIIYVILFAAGIFVAFKGGE